jgi:hypothetical protein
MGPKSAGVSAISKPHGSRIPIPVSVSKPIYLDGQGTRVAAYSVRGAVSRRRGKRILCISIVGGADLNKSVGRYLYTAVDESARLRAPRGDDGHLTQPVEVGAAIAGGHLGRYPDRAGCYVLASVRQYRHEGVTKPTTRPGLTHRDMGDLYWMVTYEFKRRVEVNPSPIRTWPGNAVPSVAV